MAKKAMKKGNYGIARFSRPCPFCSRMIYKGETLARTRMGWVHADCRLPVHRHLADAKRMDKEYREATAQ